MSDNNLERVPLYFGPPDGFPASDELPDGVKVVTFADRGGNAVDFRPDVVYDERDGETLHLQLFLPSDGMMMFGAPPKKHPLIVYVPGSAWMRQVVHMALAKMVRVCEHGYAVAVVQYRPSDVAPFPAQIEDAKTAIRFMRRHADEYRIDADKIAIWGDSSGGHTAVSVGITGDGLLDNGTYGDTSCSVNCVVDWYGATEIAVMNYYAGGMDHIAANSPEGMLIGGLDVFENLDKARKVSPLYYLDPERATPPMLIMHGDRDPLVPFNQSVRLYEALRAQGKTAELYKLIGGAHGSGGFDGDEAIELVLEYVGRYLS
ncbi:MAG: alpha/beta hydrolase [Oscillospiraceae bacterium]|jgi:acetyl esterase/lipase|nr:alpha/beta hydrolase [Oscillospiraceae bacterium]